jgi:hypothetical protein
VNADANLRYVFLAARGVRLYGEQNTYQHLNHRACREWLEDFSERLQGLILRTKQSGGFKS